MSLYLIFNGRIFLALHLLAKRIDFVLFYFVLSYSSANIKLSNNQLSKMVQFNHLMLSTTDATIQKKIYGSGMNTLIILNKGMKKIV